MNNYIIAIILIPVYILLALLGKRFLKFANGYEKGLEDAEKIRKMEENRLLDKIRAEIEQEYTKFRNMSDLWDERACGLGTALEIIDKYKRESGDKE